MASAYPYLYCVLFLLIILAIFLYGAGQHRRICIIVGLFYMFVLPLYLPFEEEYWQPNRLGGWILGIEDLMLLFVCGSAPWAVVAAILRDRLKTDLNWTTFFLRYGWLAFLGIGIFLLLLFLGWSAICSSITAQLLISILVLSFRPDLWMLGLISLLVWMPIYLSILKISYLLWPEFKTIWNLTGFWGNTLYGLPIGEILWMISGVWGYPVAIGYIVNANIRLGSIRKRPDSSTDKCRRQSHTTF
mgnify:CR=1 FL=1